jgi:hypothetical protein
MSLNGILLAVSISDPKLSVMRHAAKEHRGKNLGIDVYARPARRLNELFAIIDVPLDRLALDAMQLAELNKHDGVRVHDFDVPIELRRDFMANRAENGQQR